MLRLSASIRSDDVGAGVFALWDRAYARAVAQKRAPCVSCVDFPRDAEKNASTAHVRECGR